MDGARGSIGSVLIVGGSPEPSSARLIAELAGRSACPVVAVDRGLDYVFGAGLEPDLFCGDCDTVSPGALERLRALADRGSCAVERYDPRKDWTDLKLALDAAAGRWGDRRILITCCGGGRPDHLLAVLGTLARLAAPVELHEDAYQGRVLHAGESWTMERSSGARGFSFIPLAPGTVVSLSGMEWELDHHACELLGDLGVSNVIRAAAASMTVHEGCAVAYAYASGPAAGTDGPRS